MRNLLLTFLAFAAIVLTGCSTVMRPPPAAAFMDSYGKSNVVRSAAVSFYSGSLDNGIHENHEGYHYSNAEWWGDATLSSYISGSYFTLGWGVQTLTPFFQTGFVSPFFGLTGWSNWNLLARNPLNDPNKKGTIFSNFAGGAMAIEQAPLTEKLTLGLTEHIARNGREFYYINEDENIYYPKPRPRFYTELGVGFYASYKFKDILNTSVEFRYGRDIDEGNNRIALTLNVWRLTKPTGIGGNDHMRIIAHRDSLRFANTNFTDKATIDSSNIHQIENRWFKVLDTTKVTSTIYMTKDSLNAIYTNSICYDASTDAVRLLQLEDSTYIDVPLDVIDYCDTVEMKNPWAYPILSGAIMGTLVGLMTWNGTVGLIAGTSTTAAFWGALSANKMESPWVKKNLCAVAHTKEELVEWFSQYRCSDSPTETAETKVQKNSEEPDND